MSRFLEGIKGINSANKIDRIPILDKDDKEYSKALAELYISLLPFSGWLDRLKLEDMLSLYAEKSNHGNLEYDNGLRLITIDEQLRALKVPVGIRLLGQTQILTEFYSPDLPCRLYNYSRRANIITLIEQGDTVCMANTGAIEGVDHIPDPSDFVDGGVPQLVSTLPGKIAVLKNITTLLDKVPRS